MTDPYIESLLGDNERILHVTRQHPFLLIGSMGWEFLITVLIVVLVSIVLVLFPDLSTLAPLGYALLIIPLVGAIIDTLVWSSRQFIVTNRRVISIYGVFNKNVIDSSLEKVNDVKMTQSAMGRLFNYGDIEILTASELGVNLFKKLSDPIRFKTAMLNSKEQMSVEDEGVRPHRAFNAREIPELIARLDSLREKGILTEEEFQQKKAELLRKLE